MLRRSDAALLQCPRLELGRVESALDEAQVLQEAGHRLALPAERIALDRTPPAPRELASEFTYQLLDGRRRDLRRDDRLHTQSCGERHCLAALAVLDGLTFKDAHDPVSFFTLTTLVGGGARSVKAGDGEGSAGIADHL